MKRIGSVFCLVLLMITMTASVCFGAQDLKIEKSYPRDAQENTSKENMGVKLWFNNDMGNKTSEKANKKAFSITDSKGNKIPIRVFYNPKDSKEVMVLADAVKIAENKDLVIKDNAEYTLHISGDVTDNEGNTLGKEQKITFKTMNQAKNTQIYMVMMVIMFGAMFMFSSRQAKKKMEEERTSTKEEPFNPYKEAKRTGKSVDEVIAAHEKEMEKKAKKAARHAKPEEDDEEEYEEDAYNDGQDSSDYVDFRDYMPQKSERKAQKEVRRTSAQRQNVKHTPGRAQNSSHKASRSAQQVDFRLEKNKGRKHKKDAVAPESEKTIPYRPRKSRQKEIDLPLGSFDTEDSYHPMNDDYEEPVVIDEDELDEEVLREMMDEDDREGEELWKKISRRDDTHKKRK